MSLPIYETGLLIFGQTQCLTRNACPFRTDLAASVKDLRMRFYNAVVLLRPRRGDGHAESELCLTRRAREIRRFHGQADCHSNQVYSTRSER